jgi:hypothetical protein
MHGEYKVKFIDAQQDKTIHKFQRIKEKIHKTNAAIWFNKLCKMEQLTPRYINIRVNGNTQRSRNTQKAATKHRITQEIKFLYLNAFVVINNSVIKRCTVNIK